MGRVAALMLLPPARLLGVTIGPDDLPDPFGEGGMAQVTCGCLSEAMHLVLTAGTAQVRCAGCQKLQAEFPLSADTTGHLAGYRFSEPGERTTIDPAPMQVRTEHGGAAWGDVPPGIPPEPPPMPPAGDVPPLPRFSPKTCNVHLSGGPYNGQVTFVFGAPGADFVIAGVGRYARTPDMTWEGRYVYGWAGT